MPKLRRISSKTIKACRMELDKTRHTQAGVRSVQILVPWRLITAAAVPFIEDN